EEFGHGFIVARVSNPCIRWHALKTRATNCNVSEPDRSSPAWNDQLLRNPHHVADKRARVQRMFAAIAPSYDLNNRLHSLWMDQSWRKKAVKLADLRPSDSVLDVACGTGDLTLKFAKSLRGVSPEHAHDVI